MDSFDIYIRKERVRPYRLLAILILLVNLVFFVMYFVQTWKGWASLQPVAVALLVAIICRLIGARWWKRLPQTLLGTTLVFVLVLQVLIGFWWVAVTLLLLTALYQIAMRELVVRVFATHIEYPSFPVRRIQWPELNNLILRDGLLTVDFRNNRVAQLEALPGTWTETVFNQFCREQLRHHAASTGAASNKSA